MPRNTEFCPDREIKMSGNVIFNKKNAKLKWLQNFHATKFSCNKVFNRKLQNWPILGQNGPNFFSSENLAPSHCEYYRFASSCKKSLNFNEPISRKTLYRRTNGRTDTGEFIGPSPLRGRSKKEMKSGTPQLPLHASWINSHFICFTGGDDTGEFIGPSPLRGRSKKEMKSGTPQLPLHASWINSHFICFTGGESIQKHMTRVHLQVPLRLLHHHQWLSRFWEVGDLVGNLWVATTSKIMPSLNNDEVRESAPPNEKGDRKAVGGLYTIGTFRKECRIADIYDDQKSKLY